MNELLDSLIKDIEKRLRDNDPTAVERAKQLAEQYPDEREVWDTLAFAHALNNDMEGAIAATTRMMDITPPHPSHFYFRGEYELKRGNLQAALADFDRGIALSIELHDEWCLEPLYFLRANVLHAFGRNAEALADLEHVEYDLIETSAPFHTKFELLSACEGGPRPEVSMDEPLEAVLADIGKRAPTDPSRTLERATQLAEKYPDAWKAWRMLVYAHAINGDWDGAVIAANRLIEIAPPHPSDFLLRASYQRKRGNLEGALSDFTQAIALGQHEDNYDMEQLYFVRADVLVALGRKAEARADLEHVSDGYARMTTRVRTKEEILADCSE